MSADRDYRPSPMTDGIQGDPHGENPERLYGQYATRAELTDMMKALFAKLDRIEEKISQKADRGEIPFSQDHRT